MSLLIPPPAFGQQFFAGSKQALEKCIEERKTIAAGACMEQDKCQAESQADQAALTEHDPENSTVESATNLGAHTNNAKPCFQNANAACEAAADVCNKTCDQVAYQANSDLSACNAHFAATGGNPQCGTTAMKYKEEAQKHMAGCVAEKKQFNAMTLAALAALGALGAKAFLGAKKRNDRPDDKDDSVECGYYNAKNGILKGYEKAYKPAKNMTEEEKEKIPKSPEGRPLFHAECKTKEKEKDPTNVAECASDIDCVCKDPKTAAQQEVCGCYDSVTRRAVVSPACSTILGSNPKLKASIDTKRSELESVSEQSATTVGNNAYSSEFLFNEQEQLERAANIVNQGASGTQPSGSMGSDTAAGGGMGGSIESLPSTSGAATVGSAGGDSSELAGASDATRVGNSFSGSSGGYLGGGGGSFASSSLSASADVQRSISAIANRAQSKINPANGKGLFDLISEAYKEQARGVAH